MRKPVRYLSEKWLILGILLALVPFFQNMSPTKEDGDSVDIRELAPRKPAGDWESPYAQYIPGDFNGDSLNDVQQKLLSHNFDPMLKDLELTYFPNGDSHRAGGADLENPVDGTSKLLQESASSWRLGVINPTKLRLLYSNPELAKGFQVSCEAQTGQAGLMFRMSHPLSSQLNLGITHETDKRQSQIQVDYRW
jgi:hypothetical protein